MKEIWILGIYISGREKAVQKLQPVLAKFGCSIRTRLGLHDCGTEIYHGSGLILLELYGDPAEYRKLENELIHIQGIKVKKMIFTQE